MNDNCARQIQIEIENDYQTITSCYNCAATIATTRIPRTRKGIETTCAAFREEIRLLIARIPESGGVSEKTANLCLYEFLASGHVSNWIKNI